MGSSTKKVTVGFKYYMGLHLIFGHGPWDKVTKIEMDGRVAWTGNSTGGDITVDAPNLFGGEEKEGGVSGTVALEMGSPTQSQNSYLQGLLGTNIPAFRGVVGMVLKNFYIGMSPYLKKWEIWGSRIHLRQDGLTQWYDSKAEVNGDMNAAHIIRECLTDAEWGMGYPEADIDDTSFQAAADTMFTEGMGFSFLWDKGMDIDDFIKQVLKHADASLYVHRTTGKFVLKLARGGYSIPSLLVLDEDNIYKITDYKRATPDELTNAVTVVYWDYETGKNGSITVQDIALVASQGSTNGTTIQYPGITRGALASQIASRDLRVVSTPLASCTIYANREAASLNIGDVFVLNWPRLGVVSVVMRVMSIELGNIETNQVKITAVEDVFSMSESVYAPPPPSAWPDPISTPQPCPYHLAHEATYWEMVQRLGESAARAVDINSGFALMAAVRPSSDATNARVMTDPDVDGTFIDAGPLDFCPTALVNAAMTPNQTTITITGALDMAIVENSTYIIVGTEIMSLVSHSDTSLTVGRGCLDTVPVAHSVGERVWFSDVFCELDGIEYSSGETARMRVLPTTSKGTLAIGSATTQTVGIQARMGRPYPPQQLRLNSLAYPSSIAGDVNLSVDWVHRDRLQQTASLVNTEAGTIGPEAGTSYTIELRTAGGTLISSATGLTGVSHTFTLAAMGANYGSLRVLLWSTRDGVDSLQKHDWTFTRNTP